MDKEAAERTAAVLARRALSLLDGVDAGGSLFACRLSEALDVAVPNATDMAPRSSTNSWVREVIDCGVSINDSVNLPTELFSIAYGARR